MRKSLVKRHGIPLSAGDDARDRERLQQHLIEDCKDCRARTNAEREREARDGGDEGSAQQRSDSERETAHYGA